MTPYSTYRKQLPFLPIRGAGALACSSILAFAFSCSLVVMSAPRFLALASGVLGMRPRSNQRLTKRPRPASALPAHSARCEYSEACAIEARLSTDCLPSAYRVLTEAMPAIAHVTDFPVNILILLVQLGGLEPPPDPQEGGHHKAACQDEVYARSTQPSIGADLI